MSKSSVEPEENSFSKSGTIPPSAPGYRRHLVLGALIAIGLGAWLLVVLLAPRAQFSLVAGAPADIGPLRSADLTQAGSWVRTSGTPQPDALSFERIGASGSFRLTTIEERSNVWLVLHVPQGFTPDSFVPPSTFVGRLTPLRDAGFSARPIVRMIEEGSGAADDGYLLIDGESPRSERPALLAAILLALLGTACLSFAVHLCQKPRSPRPQS